ncbi:hypothetical protein NEIMUCOT_03746 [Neisseria mucosa ATCC 25996]|jgi:hypothetical protein|uniref:Uncharacterized protein n=1 Tax=Neisseria mucosa (strain ATCC 25996 / DSM 4631 / NCTC 10774 / M26) TaxID=546266 RepID=D2ZT13_NEIM2|nr:MULTISPECIES: hypothetical protein [Neisseria]EFC89946.1 hypothetical protein NEIMUCOT_03746 [Neisseria mucosa ATCC 25996]
MILKDKIYALIRADFYPYRIFFRFSDGLSVAPTSRGRKKAALGSDFAPKAV